MPDPNLLELIVCPIGFAKLEREGDVLRCTRCGPKFRIVDNIPKMLVEDAILPDGCNSIADLECVKNKAAGTDSI